MSADPTALENEASSWQYSPASTPVQTAIQGASDPNVSPDQTEQNEVAAITYDPQQAKAQAQQQAIQDRQQQAAYRVSGQDLSRRGIGYYTDLGTGAPTPVTDESGAPLTNFSQRSGVGYDSQGNPRKLSFDSQTGAPELKDPYEGAPQTTDKAGNVYTSPSGLPWRFEGVNPDIQQKNQEAQQAKLDAAAVPLLTGPVAMAKSKFTQMQQAVDQSEKSTAATLQSLGVSTTDQKGQPIDLTNTDPTQLRQMVQGSFDSELKSSEANDKSLFGSGLTQSAYALRQDIGNRQKQASDALDNHIGVVSAMQHAGNDYDQARAPLAAINVARINRLNDQREAAGMQPIPVPDELLRVSKIAPPPIPGMDHAGQPTQSVAPTSTIDILPSNQSIVGNQPTPQEPEGTVGSFLRPLVSGLAPALGTAAGGAVGALAGDIGGGVVPNPVSIAAAIAGDVAGGAAGGLLAQKAQNALMGGEWTEQNQAHMAANAKNHPIASALGSALPMLVSMLGGGGAAKTAGEGLEKAAQGLLSRTVSATEGNPGLLTKAMSYLAEKSSAVPSLLTTGARVTGAQAAEEDVNQNRGFSDVLPAAIKGAVTFGPTAFVPAATALMASSPAIGKLLIGGGKGLAMAATMEVSNALYDHFVEGKPIDAKEMATRFGTSGPAFAIQEALMGVLHGTAPERGGAEPPEEKGPTKPVAPTTPEPAEKAVAGRVVEPGEQPSSPVAGMRHTGTDEAKEYMDKGGWKLHLTVPPENYGDVDSWLDKNHSGPYKLLNGGDPGEKDFTVYVGDKAKADSLASKIQNEIGDKLSKNNSGSDDTAFTDKVSGRFGGQGESGAYRYYGRDGIPYDQEAKEAESQVRMASDPENKAQWQQILSNHENRIKNELTEKFGSRFYGISPPAETPIAATERTPAEEAPAAVNTEIPGVPKTPQGNQAHSDATSELESHASTLGKLDHPVEFSSGTTEGNKSGFEYNPSDQRIHLDADKVADATKGMDDGKRKEWIKRAVGEEVIHAATDKWAQEGENGKKLESLADDKEAMDHAAKTYGEGWPTDRRSQASEYVRMLIQGKEKLTESSYKVLHDFLNWIGERLGKLTGSEKEVVDGIRERMGEFAQNHASKQEAIPGFEKESPATAKLREAHQDVLSELNAARDALKSGFGDEDTEEEIRSLEAREKALRAKLTPKGEPEAKAEAPKEIPGLESKPESQVGSKVRVGNSPQLHTITEELAPQKGDLPDEKYFKVTNDKTGREQTVESKDITPVKERTAEEKQLAKAASEKTTQTLDKKLREAGLNPKDFPDAESKRYALGRKKALGAATPDDKSKEAATPEGEEKPPSESPQSNPSHQGASVDDSLRAEDGKTAGERLIRQADETGMSYSLETLKGMIREDPKTMETMRNRIKAAGKEPLGAANPMQWLREKQESIARFISDAKADNSNASLRDRIKSGNDSTGTLAHLEGENAKTSIRLDFERPAPANESRRDKAIREAQNKRDLQAARFVAEAGGDKANLLSEKAKIVASPDAKLRDKFTPIIDHAIANFDSLNAKLAGHEKLANDTYDRLTATGEDFGKRENYVRRVTIPPADPDQPNPLFKLGSGRGNSPKDMEKFRWFDTIGDAVKAGYDPGTYGIHEADQNMVTNAEKIVGGKAFLDQMKKIVSPTDKKPIIGELQKRTLPNGETETKVPDGYSMVTASGGRPMVIHNLFAGLFKSLWGDSAIRQHWTGRAALKAAAATKTLTFVADTFHVGRVLYKAVTSRNSLPELGKGLSLVEYAPKDLDRAVANGELKPHEAEWAKENRPIFDEGIKHGMNIGKIADNLADQAKLHIPGFGKINDWIFQSLTRDQMAQTYVDFAKRNVEQIGEGKRFYTRDQAIRQAAKETNEMYGNLQNQGLFQNKTMQDLSRLIFLAPQWAESQFRNEARSYGQGAKAAYQAARTGGNDRFVGNSARAFASGFVALLAANQVANYISRGQSTFQNKEDDHKLDAWLPGGKNGFWFNPFEIAGEYAHAASKYAAQHENAADIAGHVVNNKLSPMARGAKEALTGRDYAGRKFLSDTDRFRAAAVDALPSPLPLSAVAEKDPRAPFGYRVTRAPGAVEKQLLQSSGMKVTPAQSPRTQMFSIAQDYRADRQRPDIAGEYTELRRALDNDDTRGVKDEIKWLQDRGHSMQAISESVGLSKGGAIKPEMFAGSHAREQEMLAKLTPAQKVIYDQAQRDHALDAIKFLRIASTGQRPQPAETGTPFRFK